MLSPEHNQHQGTEHSAQKPGWYSRPQRPTFIWCCIMFSLCCQHTEPATISLLIHLSKELSLSLRIWR